MATEHSGGGAAPDDVVVGRRVLLALRVVVIGAVAVFTVGGIVNSAAGHRVLPAAVQLGVWSVVGIAALAAQAVCHRPARRVPLLGFTLALAAYFSLFVGLLSLLGGRRYLLTAVLAIGCGTATLAWLYRDRRRQAERGGTS